MCKVLIFSGIKPETNDNAVKFMKTMAPLMSSSNTDGLGYSAVDEAGNLFGERWHKNAEAFTPSIIIPEGTERKTQLLGKLEKVTKKSNTTYYGASKRGPYNNYGVVDLSKMTAVTMHTRFATSGKGFENTHPFYDVEADTSLIHNGIIRNESSFDLKLSTCDSESILISYIRNQVGYAPESVQSMASELIGYYACGVFARDERGIRILDIFKANGASLYTCWIDQLETSVFSTSAYDIDKACKTLGFTHGDISEVMEGYLVRCDPNSGDFIHIESFTASKEYTYSYDPKSHRQTSTTSTSGTSGQSGRTVIQLPTTTETHTKRNLKEMSDEYIAYLTLKPSVQTYNQMEMIIFSASHFLEGETGVAV